MILDDIIDHTSIITKPTFKESRKPKECFQKYRSKTEHLGIEDYLALARCFHLGIGVEKNDFFAFEYLCRCIQFNAFPESKKEKRLDLLIRAALRVLFQEWNEAWDSGEAHYCLGNAILLCNSPVYADYLIEFFPHSMGIKGQDEIRREGMQYIQRASELGYGDATFTLAIAKYIEDHRLGDHLLTSRCAWHLDQGLIQRAAAQGSQRAKLLYASSRYANTESLCQQIIDSNVYDFWDTYGFAQEKMGFVMLQKGDTQQALSYFRSGSSHVLNGTGHTSDPAAASLIGDAFWKAGELDMASYYYGQLGDDVQTYIDRCVNSENMKYSRSLLQHINDHVAYRGYVGAGREAIEGARRSLEHGDDRWTGYRPFTFVEQRFLTLPQIETYAAIDRKWKEDHEKK
ncbi:MAG: hypothetical protein IKI21_01105 [Oscillospiraceae bacterium]|nr:hypothetical protein [Oscillospiraceae bacterium]